MLKKQAIDGVFWTLIQTFGTKIIHFVVSLILARILAPSEFGIIAMISMFISVGAAIMDGGLGQSIVRSSNVTEVDYSTVFYSNLALSLVIYCGIFSVAPSIATFFDESILTNILRLYSLVIIINAFSVIQVARLTKTMNFKLQSYVSVPSILVGGLVGILMAYRGFGIWSLVLMALCQSITSSSLYWFSSKWRPYYTFNLGSFRKHINFGYKLTLTSIVDSIFGNIFSVVIGKYYSPATLGFYNRADTLWKLPVNSLSNVLSKVFFPLLVQVKSDERKTKAIYKKMLKLTIFFIAPLLIYMGVLSESLFRFLFTEKWLPAVPYFRLLIVVGMIHPVNAYNVAILKVFGKSDVILLLEVVKKGFLFLAVLCVYSLGVQTIIRSYIVVTIVSLFITAHYSGSCINYSVKDQVKDTFVIVFIAACSGLVTFFSDVVLIQNGFSDLGRLFFGSLLGTVCYILLSSAVRLEPVGEVTLILRPLLRRLL